MQKSPEEIQKDLYERFGIEVDIGKCTTYLTAYNAISRLSALSSIVKVNEEALERAAVGEAGNIEESRRQFEEALARGDKIKDKTIKAFYFRHYLLSSLKDIADREPREEKPAEGKPVEGKPVEEKPAEEKPVEGKPVDKKKKNEPTPERKENRRKIIDILKEYALRCDDLDKMLDEDGLGAKNKITEENVLAYIIENKEHFYSYNQMKTRKAVSGLTFGLSKYRDEFIIAFLADRDLDGTRGNTLRGNKEEDKFINVLLSKGICVTSIEPDVPPITSMEVLSNYLKNNGKGIALSGLSFLNFYKDFGEEVIDDPELEKAILTNISDSIFSSRVQKSDDVRKFEGLYGLRIYAYEGNAGGRISMQTLMSDILTGKVKIKALDIPHMRRNMRTLSPELQAIFNEAIKEKEEELERIRKEREAEIAEEPVEEPAPGEESPAEEVPPAEPEEDKHLAFDAVTPVESDYREMLIRIQKEFGSDHAMCALQTYADTGKIILFPPTKESSEYRAKYDAKATRDAIVLSYTKEVLRRMRDNKLGNSTNAKENLIERLIVEMYKGGIAEHDDEYMINEITQSISLFVEKGDASKFPADSDVAKKVANFITTGNMYHVMLGSELERLAQSKDEKGNPLIVESETDIKCRRFEDISGKVDLSENMFVHGIIERFAASDEVGQSTIGANLYATLLQNGKRDENGVVYGVRQENERLAQMVREHNAKFNKIRELRIEKIQLRAQLIAKGEPASAEEQAKLERLELELKKELDEYENFMLREERPGYSKMRAISEYESRIIALKKIDDLGTSPSRVHYLKGRDNKKQEVVDI